MKAVIYTRYSTDRQQNSSTVDQERVCRAWAERQGAEVLEVFSDEEISGTVRNRPAYQRLLDQVGKGVFDTLLIEDLSRLARDSLEQGRLLKLLKFHGVRVVGVSEGYDSHAQGEMLMAGIKGIFNELYVENIRFQTRRGLEGRVLRGMSAGSWCYGYDSRPCIEDNKVVGYQLFIKEDEATVIRRIFQLYAEGYSPRAIADLLNREGVPSPKGGRWGDMAIRGNQRQGRGILNNRRYEGVYVWSRNRKLKNPETGKVVRRARDVSEHVTKTMPELRIVPAELWEQVRARQAQTAERSAAKRAVAGPQARTGAGPKYLLSGLLKCGVCGGNYVVVNRYQYGCAKYRHMAECACQNRVRVAREELEEKVLAVVKARVLTRESLARFAEHLQQQATVQLKRADEGSVQHERGLLEVNRQIARLVDSIKAGIDPLIVRDELNQLNDKRVLLERQRREATPHTLDAGTLVAQALERCDEMVERLDTLLANALPEAREILRELFGGSIELKPTDDGTVRVSLTGNLGGVAALMDYQASGLKGKISAAQRAEC